MTGDFHGFPPPTIPDCDLLLFAGDLGARERFYTDAPDYRAWLYGLHERGILSIGVAGNHDFDSEKWNLPWTYLHNDHVTVQQPTRLKVWGSPLSPTFGQWAHMRPDADLAKVYAEIPEDVDVIVSHGPPFGFGDLAQGKVHAGSQSLTARLRRLTIDREKPLLVACGHIHEGYGICELGPLKIINGSYVDDRYQPGNPPIVIDL